MSKNRYSLRNRQRNFDEDYNFVVPCKRLKRDNYINLLPDEILIYIFGFVSHKELYQAVRLVCNHWRRLVATPALWHSIVAEKEIPTDVLCKWIQNAANLQEISLVDRHDLNSITDKIARHSRKLVSLKIKNCWGSHKSTVIRSQNLCRIVKKCKNLNSFYFSGIRILSCKFFKLLSQKRNDDLDSLSCCSYYGPVNQKQMRVLIDSIVNSNVYEGATFFENGTRPILLNQLFSKDQASYARRPSAFNNLWEDLVNNNDEEDYDYRPDENVNLVA